MGQEWEWVEKPHFTRAGIPSRSPSHSCVLDSCPEQSTGSSLLLFKPPSFSLGLCWEQVLLSRNVLPSEEGDLQRV